MTLFGMKQHKNWDQEKEIHENFDFYIFNIEIIFSSCLQIHDCPWMRAIFKSFNVFILKESMDNIRGEPKIWVRLL